MARAHFVKAARKDNPVAKKGEPYWWWKPMIGGRGAAKRFSKTQPTRSQLTNSEFLSAFYAICESIDAAEDVDGLRSCAEELRTLGEEQQEKFDNMPDGLQQGDTGQMLEERATGCDSWADAIEAACDNFDGEDDGEEEDDEDGDTDVDDGDDPLQALKDEINNDCPGF